MIKLSNFPIKTLKSRPVVSDNLSTSLLLQAWFIRQEMAWVYIYTTLGLKVLRKIENIVREEMDNAGANEVLMSSLGSKLHWDQTGRWDVVDVLFKLPASTWKEYALNPTHEEIVTPFAGEFIQSYKDLDFAVYQIQTKFRNEKRAKSGLLRWREFLMKDLYSFHRDEASLDAYYENMKKVYMKVFDRLGIWKDTYITLAWGWDFTDKYSHEFQTLLDIGEDDIYICDECNTSHNEEIVDLENGFECTNCNSKNHRVEKASEVGNIFPLMTKFSDAFWLKYADENWKEKQVIMGCYGIGISRLMWAIAEYYANEKWISWPENLAPADYYIIVMWEENIEKAEEIAKKLELEWKSVILDDRIWKKIGFGQKAWDCELFGIANRIVLSPKTLEQWGYELTKRGEESTIIKL